MFRHFFMTFLVLISFSAGAEIIMQKNSRSAVGWSVMHGDISSCQMTVERSRDTLSFVFTFNNVKERKSIVSISLNSFESELRLSGGPLTSRLGGKVDYDDHKELLHFERSGGGDSTFGNTIKIVIDVNPTITIVDRVSIEAGSIYRIPAETMIECNF